MPHATVKLSNIAVPQQKSGIKATKGPESNLLRLFRSANNSTSTSNAAVQKVYGEYFDATCQSQAVQFGTDRLEVQLKSLRANLDLKLHQAEERDEKLSRDLQAKESKKLLVENEQKKLREEKSRLESQVSHELLRMKKERRDVKQQLKSLKEQRLGYLSEFNFHRKLYDGLVGPDGVPYKEIVGMGSSLSTSIGGSTGTFSSRQLHPAQPVHSRDNVGGKDKQLEFPKRFADPDMSRTFMFA